MLDSIIVSDAVDEWSKGVSKLIVSVVSLTHPPYPWNIFANCVAVNK